MTAAASVPGCLALACGLVLAVGCEAGDGSRAPDSQPTQPTFRCAPDNLPAVGGFDSVSISGTPQIYASIDHTIDVFSNGDVSISGSGYIDTGAYSAKGSVSFYSGGTVSGTVIESGDRPIVDIYDTTWIGEYILDGHNDADTLGDTQAGIDPLVVDGDSYDYSVYAGDWSTLDGSLYHFQSMELSGYSTVSLTYTVTYIVVDGPITISSGAWIGSGWGTDLMIVSNSTDPITISDSDTWFSGRIYAPYAPIVVSDGAWVTGAIVGASLDVSGDSIVEVTNDALDIWLPC